MRVDQPGTNILAVSLEILRKKQLERTFGKGVSSDTAYHRGGGGGGNFLTGVLEGV